MTPILTRLHLLSRRTQGYKKDISEKLMSVDPGLPSRFPHRIVFDDYSARELQEIFCGIVKQLKKSGLDSKEPIGYWMLPPVAAALGRRVFRGAEVLGPVGSATPAASKTASKGLCSVGETVFASATQRSSRHQARKTTN